ncbi:MAG: VOC family protein [Gammaproteobacteria bacterium]
MNDVSTAPAPLTTGAHHVGLTVPDLAAAVAFFTDTLGHRVVGGKPDYPATFVSDGTVLITLWQAAPGAATFDRHRHLGLHHLALRVADLDAVATRVAAHPGISLEFAPEALGNAGTRHMMCQLPGGIRLEFIAPAVVN